ncbi:teichuronic acid biosynthesis glycosyltransferase TuaH [Peribacillus deserti]|uniref:Teichuronic acid biosynthesis glycosyltransferase TuaH n=1 Tax=Peribacillus deserti TaxID=673318 RepID=A0ABS2QCD0_9BACI|nr:glycosyltransferase [Peribacillus deserti]MBM7690815.1 teichuronic acid biosynthesis glycosyltransferase TuaH [Peribacillus deserti]
MKNIHIIVATGEWGQDNLRYRRHRLAEFLQNEPDTKEVIWLCPTPDQTDSSMSKLPNGIKQWAVQDLLPQKVFRFGRYVDSFYKKKIELFLEFLKQSRESFNLILWYTFPGFPLLADLFSWDKVIYDCSDLWAAPISGSKSVVSAFRQKVISSAEDRIVKRAELIFCTSDYLQKQVVRKLGVSNTGHVHTFENGVEYDLFAGEKEIADVAPGFDGTILGFIGGIKPKLDFALITKAARQKREWLFLFVGPDGTGGHPEFKELLQEPNVLWTGSVPPLEVPKYMNLVDIGIMPYKPSPYNDAVFPLKLYEFLAAGKPAIGVHLPSTKKYAEEMVYEHVNHVDGFIEACEKVEAVVYDSVYANRRRELAKTKDWNSVFSGMADVVFEKRNWPLLVWADTDQLN